MESEEQQQLKSIVLNSIHEFHNNFSTTTNFLLQPLPRPVLLIGRPRRIRSFPTVKATFRANYDYILDVSSSDQVRLALSRGGGLCTISEFGEL